MHTVNHNGTTNTPRRPGTRHRLSWKAALRSVLQAPVRIHRYRDLHTGMMREALCDLECGRDGWKSDNE